MDVSLSLCNTICAYDGINNDTVAVVNLEEGSSLPVLMRRCQRIDFVVRC